MSSPLLVDPARARNLRMAVAIVTGAVAMIAAGVSSPVATPESASAATARPGSSNTGVPVGTTLRVHQGDLVVTKAGTVIDSLDIRGEVYIKANNVKITRSIVRGGAAATKPRALVMAWWNFTGFRRSRTRRCGPRIGAF